MIIYDDLCCVEDYSIEYCAENIVIMKISMIILLLLLLLQLWLITITMFIFVFVLLLVVVVAAAVVVVVRQDPKRQDPEFRPGSQ